MDTKTYFDTELVSTLMHAIIGAIIGYLSFTVSNVGMSLVMMIVALVITSFTIKKVLKVVDKGRKWWLGNGIVVFIAAWFVIWTLFYNIQLTATLP